MPDRPGIDVLAALRERFPEPPVVILSAIEDRTTILKTLDLGAHAHVPKTASTARIRGAFAATLEGKVFLPQSAFARAMPGVVPLGRPARTERRESSEDGNNERAENGGIERATDALDLQLTDRQLQVLSPLVSGLSNKLIARRLDIALSTVKINVSAILRTFRVNSRTRLMIAVARACPVRTVPRLGPKKR